MRSEKPKSWGWLLLLTTSATLTCCALPILLVTVGLGSAVASMASAAPWLITLSMYKGWVFAISGILVVASAWTVYRSGRTCPSDPELAAACARADKWNRRFVWIAAIMWLIGLFFAFVLVRLMSA